jgi:hypothetical protein
VQPPREEHRREGAGDEIVATVGTDRGVEQDGEGDDTGDRPPASGPGPPTAGPSPG